MKQTCTLFILYCFAIVTIQAQEHPLNCKYNFQEALFYLKGNANIAKDSLKAIEYLKPCVAVNNAKAQLLLGHLYTHDIDEEKVAQGFELIKKSAKQDNAIAAERLGFLYKYGVGCKLNYRKAKKWYQKAYELGNDKGAYSLGYFYLKGLGNTKQDYTKAVVWFEKSKSEMASYWLGFCYLNGYGVAKDIDKANKLLGTTFEAAQIIGTTISESNLEANLETTNTLEDIEESTTETFTQTQLYGKWKGQLLKMDWSGKYIETTIALQLHFAYDTVAQQTTYTWELDSQKKIGTALQIDSSIYFDNLEVNLPHNTYHEKIPTTLDYQILSTDLEITTLENNTYLIGTLESHIADWDEDGTPIQFVLVKESATTENGVEISQEVLQALASQKDHFIQLYPNPFVSDLIIAYTLETASITHIQVSSFDGTQNYTVATAQTQEAGDYSYHFEGANLTKGIYLVNIFVDGTKKTKLIIKK